MPPDDIQNKRFTKIYLTLWGICFLVALIFFVFYKFGFRITNHFQPVKVGLIELKSNEAGAQIFFDNREQKIGFKNDGYLIEDVSPGFHSIMISKEGFWPWTKTIKVAAEARRSLFSFIFSMDGLLTKPVVPGTTDFTFATRALRQDIVPQVRPDSGSFNPEDSFNAWLEVNVPDRKISSDKNTVLFTEHNTIYVGWVSETEPPPHYFCEENPCKLKLPVMVSTEPIKSIDFYKGRGDVIIFTAGATIYAIEVDREGTQNFQPLYKGTDPHFYENDKGVLYIKDGSSILSASI